MSEDYFDFELYEIPVPPSGGITIGEGIASLVVVYKEDYETNEALITKIFAAAGLKRDDNFQLVLQEKGTNINISSLTSPETKQVISFGIAPDKLGLNAKFRGYHLYQTESYAILLSHSLKKLAESKEHKKALWDALKAIYLAN